MPIDGAKPPEAAFFASGASQAPTWSPDGRTLAFVSNRGDHSFIGLFTPNQPIRFVAPSTSRDSVARLVDGRKEDCVPPTARRGWRAAIALTEPESTWACRGEATLPPARTAAMPPDHRADERQPPVDVILRNPDGSASLGGRRHVGLPRYRTVGRTLFARHPTPGDAAAADSRRVHGRAIHAHARPPYHRLQREHRPRSAATRSPASLQSPDRRANASSQDVTADQIVAAVHAAAAGLQVMPVEQGVAFLPNPPHARANRGDCRAVDAASRWTCWRCWRRA